MKIIGVIPARYSSSRFPGKPLADICGRPMIWWVYRQLKMANGIDDVYVATDDERIKKICESLGIKSIMTSSDCSTHLERLYEFSTKVDADFYINVNGDEPLIESKCIEDMIPQDIDPESSYAANGMMILRDPIDAIDTSKIKIAVDMLGYGMYMARTPIPFPKGNSQYKLKKFVGVQCFTKKALEFVHKTKHGHKLRFVLTEATTLSVDTDKDLDKVRCIIHQKIENGEVCEITNGGKTLE